MANREKDIAELQCALFKLDQGLTTQAASLVASLKPAAAKLVKETRQLQENLQKFEEFYSQQEQFLFHLVKTLEKKYKEVSISKTVSESIQRTQQKKLQASKWELMKARSALFTAQKRLRRKEKEEDTLAVSEGSVYGFHQLILPADNETREELTSIVEQVQIQVQKKEMECTNKENILNETQKKLAEIKNKAEQSSKLTKKIKELHQICVATLARVTEVRDFLKQVDTLWSLCMKEFDNGCKQEDVLKAISKQARVQTTVLSQVGQDTTILTACERLQKVQDLTDLLKVNLECQCCGDPLTTIPDNTYIKCDKCTRIDSNDTIKEQKVRLESFKCTKHGTITGSIRVYNLAYDKQVFVHHSQDSWVSSRNTDACYKYSCSESECDHFQFQIPFNATLSLRLEFAVCYRVNGVEFWDNNAGNNYSVIL